MSRNAAVALHGTTHRVVVPTPRHTLSTTGRTTTGRTAAARRRPALGVLVARLLTAAARGPRLTHDARAQQLLHRAAAQQAGQPGQGWRDEWLVRGTLR